MWNRVTQNSARFLQPRAGVRKLGLAVGGFAVLTFTVPFAIAHFYNKNKNEREVKVRQAFATAAAAPVAGSVGVGSAAARAGAGAPVAAAASGTVSAYGQSTSPAGQAASYAG
jgi:hypothetical protein